MWIYMMWIYEYVNWIILSSHNQTSSYQSWIIISHWTILTTFSRATNYSTMSRIGWKPESEKNFPWLGLCISPLWHHQRLSERQWIWSWLYASADYTLNRSAGDCRYNVPKGLLVIPDVSCVTSFASTVIQNTFELHKSLSASVSASGDFGAFSFLASLSYKQTSSEVSSAEKVYITSTAKCSYYFSKIDLTSPPPLHAGFYRWAKALEKNSSKANLLKFVKYYGTHFPTGVVFGARFVNVYSMTSKSYKTASSRDISVSAQASYSGLISVSGGFNLDKSQREAASAFSKTVESTTVSVGAAPPSNGDAAYWASSVKDNPVPISYQIQPIANLFTPAFMQGTAIKYDFLRRKLTGIEKTYCQQLLKAGTVNTLWWISIRWDHH